ncbi:MAG: NUDIX hydrolase [Chloroflexi bacterium]|nr:NUDIX hydrolase [Chloroflexota bacterium]
MTSTDNAPVDRASGGVVERSGPTGTEIAVIHRARHKDWTLPKGHPKGSETWGETAVREVHEETGCKAELESLAGSVSYIVHGVPKIVVFFRMRLVEEGDFRPSEEVDKLEWMTPRRAVTTLTHEGERGLLMRLFELRATSPRLPWIRRILGSGAMEYERLSATLAAYKDEFEVRDARSAVTAGWDWAGHGRVLLRNASQALAEYRLDEAWRYLNAAKRLEVFGMSAEELAIEHVRVRSETGKKLRSWRLEAAELVLNPSSDSRSSAGQNAPPTASSIYAAREILDEHYANVYFKLRLLGQRLAVLPAFMLLALLALFLSVYYGATGSEPGTVLGDWKRLVSVMALGSAGAVLSAIITAVRGAGRIPELFSQKWFELIRPLVGAASAVVVLVVLEAGVTSFLSVQGAVGYPLAVLAGFSERLVTKAMESMETAAEK